MRRIDPGSDLQDGIEPAPPPNRNLDGTAIIPPARSEVPPRPTLCQAGPCRNYHRFATQVDAANPRAVRLPIAPNGSPNGVYQAPAVFHVEVHHYCYPTVGIETNLGALPVTECNRWDPLSSSGADQMRARISEFMDTMEGRAHAQSIADWERARSAELEEAREAERLMAGALEEDQARRACQFCGQRFTPNDLDAQGACSDCAPRALIEAEQRALRKSAAATHDKEPTP